MRLGWVIAGFAALALAPQAGAATPIGQTFAPAAVTCDPDDGLTHLQSGSPGQIYVVPQPGGVVTSWSVQAPADPPQVRLKTAFHAGGNNFTIRGQSAIETLAPGALNSFATRVPVRPGELIGYAIFGDTIECIFEAGHTGFSAHAAVGDVPPGTTANYSPLGFEYQLDIAAVVEPDFDGDGFGDETQDLCPTDASKQGECVPPQTEITKKPKDPTKKKRATFEFGGTDPRALAGFECSLDEGPFAPCSSPHAVRVKRGLHSFAVRALDAAGNVDPTPAEDLWRVKRKKKRK